MIDAPRLLNSGVKVALNNIFGKLSDETAHRFDGWFFAVISLPHGVCGAHEPQIRIGVDSTDPRGRI